MKFIDLQKNKEYYIFYFPQIDELRTFSERFYGRNTTIYYKAPKLYKAKFEQIVGNITKSYIRLDFNKEKTLIYNNKTYRCSPRLSLDVRFPERTEKESQTIGNNILCMKGEWIIAQDKQTIKHILRNIYRTKGNYLLRQDEEGHTFYTKSNIYVTKNTNKDYLQAIKILKQ